MHILLVGKGAREHALAWKLGQSKLINKLWLWPGNPAMRPLGEQLDLPADASALALADKIKAHNFALVVVGPEAPLADGLADLCLAMGVPVFGPVREAAQLESSKAYAKEFMRQAGVPTAAFRVAGSEREAAAIAAEYLQRDGGVVLKASGLAAGKGVFVCESSAAVDQALVHLYHGEMQQAAREVVVEELMRGRECSYFSFFGALGPKGLGFAVDFKRLEDGNEGPNTGGMGCYTPVPWLPKDAEAEVVRLVIEPVMAELKRRKLHYTGCLYVGLMWTKDGPKVVEFNVRLGDPECEVLALADDRDWLALMAAQAGVAIPKDALEAKAAQAGSQAHAVCVVLASAGYPFGKNGSRSKLPRSLFALEQQPVKAFAAAISEDHDGEIVTGIGRVLTLSAKAENFAAARTKIYASIDTITKTFKDARYRRDIAQDVDCGQI